MVSMRGLILGGGYGTRLYPLTRNQPKPLLSLGNQATILDILIGKMQRISHMEAISIVSNHKFYGVYKEWIAHRGLDIELIDDGTNTPVDRLGAMGDIGLVIERYKDNPFGLLVLGGDNLFDWELTGFAELINAHPTDVVIGLYDLRDRAKACRFGTALLNGRQKVIGFEEKSNEPVSTLIGMCLYWFPVGMFPLIIDYLQQDNTNKDTSGSFINWLVPRWNIYGITFEGVWLDIGHPDTYKKAQDFFKQGVFSS